MRQFVELSHSHIVVDRSAIQRLHTRALDRGAIHDNGSYFVSMLNLVLGQLLDLGYDGLGSPSYQVPTPGLALTKY